MFSFIYKWFVYVPTVRDQRGGVSTLISIFSRLSTLSLTMLILTFGEKLCLRWRGESEKNKKLFIDIHL